MELNLVTEGLKFMVLGMSTVFLFLVIMVGVLQVQSAIIMKFFPKPATEPSASSGTTTSSAPDDATRIAVITAAIQMFRRKQRS